MKPFGALLVVLGIVMLVYGGFSYTRDRKVLDVGPLEAHVNERHTVPFSPIFGGLALAAGLVLVLASRRSSTP